VKVQLDYALTKPADAQLFVSVREYRFLAKYVMSSLALIVLGVAISQLAAGKSTLWSVLGFFTALLMGAVMIYCFWLIDHVHSFLVRARA
jgi:ABC-type uncharacterized transport system permease subunit